MYQVDLHGKVALVTGGSRGLGRAMALGLAQAGADVVIASRKLPDCEEVAREAEALGVQAMPISCHTGDTASIDALIEAIWARFGRLDILVNNAGINPATASLTDLTDSLFQKVLDVNLKGPWYLASRAAPRMRDNGGGSIINVVSVGGIKPSPHQGAYAASKAALSALTRVMAAEWAGWGIRVNDLAPGSHRSTMFDNACAALPGFEAGAKAQNFQQRIAAPEEIVGAVVYLASDMSSFATGMTLISDGGYVAH
jgi:NAD(P)-dependent dehydrogenase (short-subunit alcohol dehydrogenase family)